MVRTISLIKRGNQKHLKILKSSTPRPLPPSPSHTVNFDSAILLYPLERPTWARNYTGLPIPRLGDLPTDVNFLKFYMKFYETELSKAAQQPAR